MDTIEINKVPPQVGVVPVQNVALAKERRRLTGLLAKHARKLFVQGLPDLVRELMCTRKTYIYEHPLAAWKVRRLTKEDFHGFERGERIICPTACVNELVNSLADRGEQWRKLRQQGVAGRACLIVDYSGFITPREVGEILSERGYGGAYALAVARGIIDRGDERYGRLIPKSVVEDAVFEFITHQFNEARLEDPVGLGIGDDEEEA